MDIGYFDESKFRDVTERCTKLISLINGLMRYLRNSARKA